MCIIASRKGITVKQTVRLNLLKLNQNINSATFNLGESGGCCFDAFLS